MAASTAAADDPAATSQNLNQLRHCSLIFWIHQLQGARILTKGPYDAAHDAAAPDDDLRQSSHLNFLQRPEAAASSFVASFCGSQTWQARRFYE